MISETAVQCFLAAAQNGSFTKTAEELYMTRQAVSKQIAQLEKALGMKLFERTTASVRLTPVGILYHTFFKSALKEWEKTNYLAHAMIEKQNNRVRIGLPYDMVLEDQVYRAVEKCREEGLDLQLECERYEAQELLQKLLDNRLDVIISFTRPLEELIGCSHTVDRQFFRMMSAVLLVSKKHPLAAGGARATDFQNEPCFITADMLPKDNGVAYFKAEWKMHGLELADVRLAPNRDSMKSMVELGLGFTICTELDSFTMGKQVVTYPLNRKLELYCIWRHDEKNTPVLAFLDEFNKLSICPE